MTDESSLIHRARQGEQRAFRLLYEAHVDPLYRFLKQFSGDHHEVEEWVQRAFIKAFRRLESFEGRSRFSTWIFTIGLNEMRTDRRRGTILPFEPLDNASPLEAAETDQFQWDDLDQFQWDDLMREWLGELSELKRAISLLFEVEGYSHSEIAEILDIKESSSRTILTRTRHWLRERWDQERRAAG